MVSESDSGCLVIWLDAPPANSLNRSLRADLYNRLKAALRNDEVSSIVLAGKGAAFCAGADLDELDEGTAFAFPSFQSDIVPMIRLSLKPIVAAIGGTALGEGLNSR